MRRVNAEVADLDVTPFLSLMIVLLPILLISAKFEVFSSIDLSMPASRDDISVVNEKINNIAIDYHEDDFSISSDYGRLIINTGSFKDKLKQLNHYLTSNKLKHSDDEVDIDLTVYGGADYRHVIDVVDAITVNRSLPDTSLYPQIAINMANENDDVSED